MSRYWAVSAVIFTIMWAAIIIDNESGDWLAFALAFGCTCCQFYSLHQLDKCCKREAAALAETQAWTVLAASQAGKHQ